MTTSASYRCPYPIRPGGSCSVTLVPSIDDLLRGEADETRPPCACHTRLYPLPFDDPPYDVVGDTATATFQPDDDDMMSVSWTKPTVWNESTAWDERFHPRESVGVAPALINERASRAHDPALRSLRMRCDARSTPSECCVGTSPDALSEHAQAFFFNPDAPDDCETDDPCDDRALDAVGEE